MAEFKWIQMSFFLMLMFPSAEFGVLPFGPYILTRVGEDITLPCLSLLNVKEKCKSISWIFSSFGNHRPTELIVREQTDENGQSSSDRLSVTANCSLVVKKVTAEDAGHYYCEQHKAAGLPVALQTVVELFVVNMTVLKGTHKTELSCTVVTNGEWCYYNVRWLNNFPVNGLLSGIHSDCSETIFIWEPLLNDPSRDDLLKCEVTDTNTGKVHLFTFGSQPSGDKTDLFFWRSIIVSVGLAALLTTVVAVKIWTRIKGNKTQMDNITVHYDKGENDVAVIYEHV